ncbi:TP53 apoptosis effector [Sarotherodon galilaeus]
MLAKRGSDVRFAHAGYRSGSRYGSGSDTAFEGVDELGQPSSPGCDVIGLQMRPLEDAADILGHSFRLYSSGIALTTAVFNTSTLASAKMPRKNKRSQAQKKRWKPLDLVDPAVPMLTGHNQDEAVSSFPSDQTAPARLSLETQDRPTSLCSPGTKTAPASLSLETENRPTSLCPPGSKTYGYMLALCKHSETHPPAKRVWATDDFHTASNSPPKKPFHNTNEELLTEELQSNAVQHFWCVSATHCQSDERYTKFSRNHQCTCNALTFLAYLNEEHQFNTARLDKVLEQGDALYCRIKTNLQQERRYTQDHLTMEDLPKEVHADINVYSSQHSQRTACTVNSSNARSNSYITTK